MRILEVLQDSLSRPAVLQDSLSHAHADVRKAVVFAIVDMYRVLGARLTPLLSGLSRIARLTPLLSGLSPSQLKLVTIYFTREGLK
ncbi:hypothetical protein T484DRAFT_1831304 [Baffinella frigidus]|nr:hypothetical protein T484DRAFT_1831304 [Cryptophyta sp. CCMP2293]